MSSGSKKIGGKEDASKEKTKRKMTDNMKMISG